MYTNDYANHFKTCMDYTGLPGFSGGWLHMRKQWVPGLFCLFDEQPGQTLLSATCKQPFQCTTVWSVLTFDVNKCAFVVSLVSLCLCVGDSN